MRVDVPAATVFLVTTRLIEKNLRLFNTLEANEWITHPNVRLGRFCVTPQVSRVRLLENKHLPFEMSIMPNVRTANQFVPFLEMDFRFLYQVNYENEMKAAIKKARTIENVADVIEGREKSVYKVIYNKQQSLESLVSRLGIEPIAIGGSFPWVYRGVAHFVIEGVNLYLTCKNLFPCDDILFRM